MKRSKACYIAGVLTLGLLLGSTAVFSSSAVNTSRKTTVRKMTHREGAQNLQQKKAPRGCEAMMGKCKLMNSRIDVLAAKMKAATGLKKIDAMADLLGELVAQRKSMHKMMMNMRGGMKSRMLKGMSGASMRKCKLMNSRIDALAAKMKAATGREKIDAMADLLGELVAQRKSMHKMMMNMRGGMSCGSMRKCKMMKKMMMQKKMQQREAAPAAGKKTSVK